MLSPREKLEQQTVIALAGLIAQRDCLKGSEAGWVRMRPWDEVKAFHESAHGVIASVYGHVARLTIIPDGDAGYEGLCTHNSPENVAALAAQSTSEREAATATPARKILSDRQTAAGYCMALATEPTWRAALAEYRRLKAQAESLVSERWPVIAKVATVLLWRRELSYDDFEALIAPHRAAAVEA
jgi:hypothetical protein